MRYYSYSLCVCGLGTVKWYKNVAYKGIIRAHSRRRRESPRLTNLIIILLLDLNAFISSSSYSLVAISSCNGSHTYSNITHSSLN